MPHPRANARSVTPPSAAFAAELTTLYPLNMALQAAAIKASNELSGTHFLVNTVWDIRTKALLRVIGWVSIHLNPPTKAFKLSQRAVQRHASRSAEPAGYLLISV